MIFNKTTRELVIVNKDGEIVTYFKSTERYWKKKLKEAAASASSSSGAAQ